MPPAHPVTSHILIQPPADFVPFAREEIEQSLADRFESQVLRWPERTAVAARDGTLTYAQLNARANGIAAALPAASLPPALPVAVLVGQGAAQAAAILGVLKAGRAYVGLDPWQEPQGHHPTLVHCGADVLLCDGRSRALALRLAAQQVGGAGVGPLSLIDIDSAAATEHNPKLVRSPDDLAYIYYTSGTSGVQKGVFDNQRNVLHNVMRYTNNLGVAGSDRLSLVQAVAFSGAVSSLFCALLNGATSLPVDLRADGVAGAAEWLDVRGATMLHAVPSIFERLLASGHRFARLRVVRLEGDLASARHAKACRHRLGPSVVLANGLGATETGLSHQFICAPEDAPAAGALPVGWPCSDTQGVVVGPNGAELGRGEVGELCIRSRYLALGYWRRPELTAARFAAAPGGTGERIYRTGDLGRYAADGCLELLGRADSTLKLNGKWVDAQAIEAALSRVDGVREAVVKVHHAAADEGALVAYLLPTSAARPSAAALRLAVIAALGPDAVGPPHHVWLDAWPLDANGKVQRDALPAPLRRHRDMDTAFVVPATGLEQTVARLWGEVLGLAEVGALDDFSALGGSSLQAIDIITRVEALFGLRGQASRLIEASTVAAMAQRVQRLRGTGP